MPHKHSRKVGDSSATDLPPTSFAKPLPVGKSPQAQPSRKRKRRGADSNDDTPNDFKRLMQRINPTSQLSRRALDNGDRKVQGKKRKQVENESKGEGNSKASSVATPRIMPGEKMSDFSARVNMSLPIAGLNRKSKNIEGMKERQTKTEKKMQRMQAEWRADEAKRKEREEEARDLADQEDAETLTGGSEGSRSRPAKKGKKRKGAAEDSDLDDDPWASLKSARGQPARLFDVAQAPPTFKKVPREIFKVKDGARVDVGNVPTASGSLRKREELGATRKSVIEGYRKLMEQKRSDT